MIYSSLLQAQIQLCSNRMKTFIWAVCIGLYLILVSGCSADEPIDTPVQLPEVEVITVTARTVPDEPEFIGQTEAFRPVEIRPQVSGIIKEVYFTEGRNVKKNDKLYLIDPVPFNAIYEAMKAKVAQHKARLVQVEQNLARVRPLLEQQAVSQKDVDDAVAEVLSAKAALDAAQNDQVKAKFDLDNTLIYAPVKGRISRSNYYEGQLISAQTTLLNTIDQLDPMYVTVNVPESYLLRRRRELAEDTVQRPDIFQLLGVMTFSDGSVYPEKGILDFAAVTISSATGTLQGRFKFSNPEGDFLPGQSYFYPGQFVKIRIQGIIRPNAILIPQRAVQQSPAGSFVFVIDEEDKAEFRSVKASTWYGNEWLIESGLEPGERVVVEGFHRIQSGTRVSAASYEQAASSNNLPNKQTSQKIP